MYLIMYNVLEINRKTFCRDLAEIYALQDAGPPGAGLDNYGIWPLKNLMKDTLKHEIALINYIYSK